MPSIQTLKRTAERRENFRARKKRIFGPINTAIESKRENKKTSKGENEKMMVSKLKKKQAELDVIEIIMSTLEYRRNDWKRELDCYIFEMDEEGKFTKKKNEIKPGSWEEKEIEELTAKLEAADAITEYLEKRI